MRSADLRKLKPFIDAIEDAHTALRNSDFGRCGCRVDETNRFAVSRACKRQANPCRTSWAIACRVYLTSVRLVPDHLDDLTLVTAIDDLHQLVLDLPRLTPTEFQERVHAAMHVEVNPPDTGEPPE